MVKNNENAIREAAYYIWQNSGCPSGQDEQIWWLAVEQVSGAPKKSSAKSSSASTAKKVSSTKPIAAKTTAAKKKAAPKKTATK